MFWKQSNDIRARSASPEAQDELAGIDDGTDDDDMDEIKATS